MSAPVIAALDPSNDDVAPAALGFMFARLASAPLVLASVHPVERHAGSAIHEDAYSLRRTAARLEQAAGTDVAVTTTVATSGRFSPDALHKLAERAQARLLVIGSAAGGHNAVTDRLLHGAPCSAAVAPPELSFAQALKEPRLIGAAFIDTPDGRAALTKACMVAFRARGYVRVLTVAESQDPTGPILSRGIDAVRLGRLAGGEILSGASADALAAASRDLDLLVCGSRGRGPVCTLLLGGTTHALVHEASCPVLVVPHGPSARYGETRRAEEHAVGA